MEKKAYDLVQTLKYFRVYILHSHVIAYIPNSVVKDILTQPDPDGRRRKWIAVLLEYDLEIKLTKLVIAKGLSQLMAQSNYDALGINFISDLREEIDDENSNLQVLLEFLSSPCYKYIIYVLQHLQARVDMDKTRARFIKLKAVKYCILNGYLYWKDLGGILLNCLLEEETKLMIKEFHDGDYRGHHYWKAIVNKILRAGFYWPSIFSDVHKKVTSCHKCQIFEGKWKLLSLPLNIISIKAPFQQRGLDFIGEINPSLFAQHKWILTGIDYFTKWIEDIPTRKAKDNVIIQFIEDNILTKFGFPRKIIIDNAQAFKSNKLINFCEKKNITLNHSTTYYPLGNSLAESSNKTLITIIKSC